MKQTILLLLLLTGLGAGAQTDDKEAITRTLLNYMDGGTERDSVRFASAFDASGLMQYMRNDTLKVVPLSQFRTGTRPGPKLNRSSSIDYIHIQGNAAQAGLTIEYPTFYFRDMMSLLKTAEGWKIVSKIFYREEKKK
jgi:hypothetical protein